MKNKTFHSKQLLLAMLFSFTAPILFAQNIPEKHKNLVISDGTYFVPKEYFPGFSWQTTPMYYMFGDTDSLLAPHEAEFIAKRTNFLTIEKSHGFKPLGAAELGAKHEVAVFKKIRPETKVLFYFNSAYVWPFTSYTQKMVPEKINDYPELKNLLLIDPKTGELAYKDGNTRHVYLWDVLNPECRKWWVNTVVKGVDESGADGAFIDQMHGHFWLREDKKEEVHKAQGELIKELKRKLGLNKIVLGNNTTDAIARYAYPAIDANMFEHYSPKLLSKEKLLQDWEDMLRLAKDGKMSIWRIGVNQGPFKEHYITKNDSLSKNERMFLLSKKRIEYHLACFLIGAQPYSFFQYGWGWTLSDGSLYDYPELQKPLGAPKGAYKRIQPDGWEFTREFESAKVWLDTEKGLAKIIWKK
nr:putative glycoside hydrolase [uncultured Allomuricauda sp.]